MKTKSNVKKALAGATILGALTLPLGGVASAESGRAPSSGASGQKVESENRREGSSAGKSVESNGTSKESQASVQGLRSSCGAQVDRRLKDLDKLAARVAKSETVTDAHAAAIATILADAKGGLTELKGRIDSATTVDALRSLCRSVVVDFRIYALRTAQVNVVLAADALDAKDAAFVALRSRLVEAMAANGASDNAEALALLDSFDGHVDAMNAAADNLGDAVLEVTVADYNANPRILREAVESIKTARKHAKDAAQDARKLLELVKNLPPTTTSTLPEGVEIGTA